MANAETMFTLRHYRENFSDALFFAIFYVICITCIHIHYAAFFEASSFYYYFHLLPYSTVTIFAWRNFFVFVLLPHTSINNIMATWFIWVPATVTIYCSVISIIVIHINALMQCMLK